MLWRSNSFVECVVGSIPRRRLLVLLLIYYATYDTLAIGFLRGAPTYSCVYTITLAEQRLGHPCKCSSCLLAASCQVSAALPQYAYVRIQINTSCMQITRCCPNSVAEIKYTHFLTESPVYGNNYMTMIRG